MELNKIQVIQDFQQNFFMDKLVQGEGVAMNYLFSVFQNLLLDNDFDLVDLFLAQFDCSKYPLKFLVGFLSVTNPWKNQLTQRENLLKFTENKIITEIGLERVEPILAGLR